jgi:hypothetical protein
LVAWTIKAMGGMIPRTDDALLGDSQAVEAINCDLSSGSLVGLPEVSLIVDLSSTPGSVERAYRLPGPVDTTDPPIWLPLPSRYSSVVRSPIANDTGDRVYWTNPGDIHPWWTTYARLSAGQPAYNLGTLRPTQKPVVSASGGDTTVPEIERSYTYTYINLYGEESAPSPPSDVVAGAPDATWTVTNLPTAIPANPSDGNYPPIVTLRLYRTITSSQSGAQFYMVTDLAMPTSGTYVDSVGDQNVANNGVLEAVGWENPPDYLDGLTSLPGGILVGFTGNTVHFCEPNRPHTWPIGYDQSVHYNIISLASWQQYLMVLTTGYPSTGSGNVPGNFILVQSQVPEPCISRGSVVTDLTAVYYASQNGLVQLSGYGIQNQTLLMVEKNDWLNRFHAESIIACRHRSQYLAINNTNSAFLVDYTEPRLGFGDLSTFQDVVCIWNDEYTGETMLCANKKIYLWDDPDTPHVTYRWRSKRFFTPVPISLGAAQVTLGTTVYDTFPPGTPLLSNGDTTVVLPAGINAVFNLYAGPKLDLIMTRNLVEQQEIFRLPKGFKAFDWQCEIVARVKISSIQLATTLAELKGV